jgi:hypothetical protein
MDKSLKQVEVFTGIYPNQTINFIPDTLSDLEKICFSLGTDNIRIENSTFIKELEVVYINEGKVFIYRNYKIKT